MKRILVAAMHHESNTFNPIIAGENDFKVIYGDDIFDNLRDNDSVTGIIKTLANKGYKVIPTVFARAVPNGEVDFKFYKKIKDEIISRAKESLIEGGIDAITLSLHGSMRAEGFGEVEGDILEELRKVFPNTPIISSLDMHTTMSVKMHKHADGFVGYKCAPHTDCFETGEHAANMTIDVLENGKKPVSAWVRVPILIAGEKSSTNTEPMIELIKTLRKSEEKEGIMGASYLMGFPWADNEDSSIGVYVVADGNQKLAEDEALKLAEFIWSKRDEFTFQTETYGEKESLDKAFQGVKEGTMPIYISDSGDNPTAGSSSDVTNFLKLIMDDKRTDDLKHPVIYGGIYDPIATKECEGRVGEEITLTFGGKFDPKTSKPITSKGLVKSYVKDWTSAGGIKGDIALFSSQGVDIVLAQQHIGYTSPDLFIALGVDPKEVEIVVCKLGYLTHDHEQVSKRSIMALSKGSTNEDLESIDYKKIKRPIFPLDRDFEYKAVDNLMVKTKK
nr:M81 family metallopeptidase [Tissierella sp.]